jgi:putative phosphoesterase
MPEHRREPGTVVVGVLADTHVPRRMSRLPEAVLRIFKGVDLILHAGDVDRIELLRELAALAPLHAVRGNLHFRDLSDGGRDLPVDLQLTIAGRRVVVNHGGWPDLMSLAGDYIAERFLGLNADRLNRHIAARLLPMYPQADVIIFGHSHHAYQAWHGQTFIFNPGGVCPTRRRVPSVGKLYLGPDSIEAEVITLPKGIHHDQSR